MSDAALLLLDVQVDPIVGGAASAPHADELIPIFNEYAYRFAHAGLPVYVTRSDPDRELYPGLQLPPGATIVTRRDGTATEASIMSVADPRGRPLATALSARGAGTLFVGGLAAEDAMDAAVRAALRDFDVVLLIDALRGSTEVDGGASAIGTLQYAGARVATLRSINEFIAGIEPGARGR